MGGGAGAAGKQASPLVLMSTMTVEIDGKKVYIGHSGDEHNEVALPQINFKYNVCTKFAHHQANCTADDFAALLRRQMCGSAMC